MKKKKAAEIEEKIEAMGQESETKARKWVREVTKEEELKAKKIEDDKLTVLDDMRKKYLSYKGVLMQSLHDLILRIGMPSTYEWGVWFDGKGIIVAIKDKLEIRHHRAFKITNDPKYDLNAVKEFARWIEDIYDTAEGNLKHQVWTPRI